MAQHKTSRCQMIIPSETLAYVAILGVVVVGAIMREINLLIILSGLMAGPLLISWQLIRMTLRKLQVERRAPRGIFPGGTLVVEVAVSNQRKRLDSWGLRVEDRIRAVADRRRYQAVQLFIPHIAAGDRQVAFYRVRLSRRGRYRLGPLHLSTRVPLGLLGGRVSVKLRDELVVYPMIGQLMTRWQELVRVGRMGQQSDRKSQGPIEGDFYGLRDWRSGDSRRWIHWRSSAKRNEPVVRQFEQYRCQDFVILLDLHAGSEDDEMLEKAISFTATLMSEHAHRSAGHVVMGMTTDSLQVIRGPSSQALLNDALEILADAQAQTQDRLPSLLRQVLPRVSIDDRILVVGTQPIDLLDSDRFGDILQDPRWYAVLSRALCLNVSDTAFDNMFQMKSPEGDAAVDPPPATIATVARSA